jgi:hypothetical protein
MVPSSLESLLVVSHVNVNMRKDYSMWTIELLLVHE